MYKKRVHIKYRVPVLLIEHTGIKPYKYGDNFHEKSVQLGF